MMRTWIARLTLIFLVPFLLIGSVETVFRLIDYGNPVSFFVPSAQVEGKLIENSKFPWRFLPSNLARAPQPTSLMLQKTIWHYESICIWRICCRRRPRACFRDV
ncbi:MAG: hypothetical protein ACJZ70_03550 [Limisphaerales bacterium]